ncbi:MAG: NYN domain-containing protein [Candidatus Rokubacteria bacterium]|nr:NYN domain-containing protein [Candidatus Rokubacteria bacterium]
MKVYIFIDGQNFYRALQRYDDTLRVDYDRLATWITQAVGGPSAFFGGAYYYVGVSPDAPPQVEGFLKGLELRQGYYVRREPRKRRTGRCPACGVEYDYTTEKRVDSRMVAELIHFAANGTYDAAVLLSGDDDFVPAVEAVNALGKQVWVATWSAEELSTELRVRCFGQIRLSDGVPAFRAERARVGSADRAYAGRGYAPPERGHQERGSQERSYPDRVYQERAPLGDRAAVGRFGGFAPRAARPAPPVGPNGVERALLELQRAEARLPHVSRGYFVTRWKSHQLPPAGQEREQLVQQMLDTGLIEEFQVTDAEGRTVTAIRSRDKDGNVAPPE